MNETDGSSAEERFPIQGALRGLPLGFQVIWVKPIYSREELSRILLTNDKWRSRGPARTSRKPISKIVLPEDHV
jgi:hypothetical protein